MVRTTAAADKYKSAVLISGLVTFTAAYHYFRIFNSWVEAYSYNAGQMGGGCGETGREDGRSLGEASRRQGEGW